MSFIVVFIVNNKFYTYALSRYIVKKKPILLFILGVLNIKLKKGIKS